MVSKVGTGSQRATPELLKSQENVCNTAPTARSFSSPPGFSDRGWYVI